MADMTNIERRYVDNLSREVVTARARIRELEEALRDMLEEAAPPWASCLLCGTRGEAACCPQVARARAALGEKPR